MKRVFVFLSIATVLVIFVSIIIVNWNITPDEPLDKAQYRPLDLDRYGDNYAQQEDWINIPYQMGLHFAGYPNVDGIIPDKVTVFYVNRKRQIIVTQQTTRVHDDSISAREIRVDMILEGDSWEIEWAGGRWRCQPGRGSSTWTSRLCS